MTDTNMIKFDLPKSQSSIIKVIGVGGGGSNAVNHMFRQGIEGVDFIVCNTDSQALDQSPVHLKVQIGSSLTEGRGAGSIPAVGKNAAIENIDQLKSILETNTKMLFITAGMGGGTGTGAAPVIAATAKEMGILTVAIVTIPFVWEGRKRKLQADEGIRELKKNVDTLLVVCNDKLRDICGNMSLREAFAKADNILTTAAKGIAEIITVPGYVNVDFEDVKTVMKNSGVAIMGSGFAEGEDRAIKAVQMALSSPLLNDSRIKGASNILLYISSGEEEVKMDEVSEITDYIQGESGATAEIIWGNGTDDSLGNKLGVTIVATGFDSSEVVGYEMEAKPKEKTIVNLEDVKVEEKITAPIQNEIEDFLNFTLKSNVQEQHEKKNQDASEVSNIQQKEQKTIENTEIKRKEPVIENTLFPLEPFLKNNEAGSDAEQNVVNENQTLVKPENVREEVKPVNTETIQRETDPEVVRLNQERVRRLKELSTQIKTPQGLSQLEKEPAYIRKNVTLSNIIPSSDSHVSRYTLTEGDDKSGELKQNNTFLHDNVD